MADFRSPKLESNMKQYFLRYFVLLAVTFFIFNDFFAVAAIAQSNSTIAGKIISDGQPFPAVEIILKPIHKSLVEREASPLFTVIRADMNGNYRFVNISAGDYHIVVHAPAYISEGETHSSRGYEKVVNIKAGENIENLDFTLLRGGVITGKVTDEYKKPLIAQKIVIFRLDAQGKHESSPAFNSGHGETDDRGVYRIYGLEAGRYIVGAGAASGGIVEATNNRALYKRTYYPNATDEAKASIIEIKSGDEIEGVDIILSGAAKSYIASGRVIDDESGKPVSGATIAYTESKNFGGYSGGTANLSNSNGEFRLTGLLSNSYKAYVVNPGQSESYSEPVDFEVTNSDVSNLEIKIKRGAYISGVALIEGTQNPALISQLAKVSLRAESTSQDINTTMTMLMTGGGVGNISPDGTFRIGGVRPGLNRILAFPPEQLKELTFNRVELNGIKINELKIENGQQVNGIRLVFTYGTGILAGRVEITGGKLPQGAQINVIVIPDNASPDDWWLSKQTMADVRGSFILAGLSRGVYKVSLNVNLPDAAVQLNLPKVERTVTIVDNIRQEIVLVLALAGKENFQ